MICTHKAQFYTYVLARTANLTDFRRRQKLDDVSATHGHKVRSGKFHFRSASSSHFFLEA